MTLPLAGLAVLVTRPAERAGPLCERLASLGAEPVPLPTIAIASEPVTPALAEAVRFAAGADWWAFVSRSAVEHGFARLRELGPLRPARVIAIGPATSAALEAEGVTVDIVPEAGFTSEDVLSAPALRDLAGQRVAIFRGRGGRELLARTLTERGAEARFVEVYRRLRPEADAEAAFARWRRAARRALVVTSLEGLDNLIAMRPERDQPALAEALLVTVSARVAAAAAERGFHLQAVAPAAGDDAVVRALLDEFGKPLGSA